MPAEYAGFMIDDENVDVRQQLACHFASLKHEDHGGHEGDNSTHTLIKSEPTDDARGSPEVAEAILSKGRKSRGRKSIVRKPRTSVRARRPSGLSHAPSETPDAPDAVVGDQEVQEFQAGPFMFNVCLALGMHAEADNIEIFPHNGTR